MKKKGILLLSLLSIFALVGCESTSSTTGGVVTPTPTPTPVEDDDEITEDPVTGDDQVTDDTVIDDDNPDDEVIDDSDDSDDQTGEDDEDEDDPSTPVTNGKITLGSGLSILNILSSVTVTPVFTDTTEEDLTIGDYDTSKILVEQANDGNHSITITVLEGDANETVTFSNSDGVSVSYIVRGRSSTYSQSNDDSDWFDDITLTSLDSDLKDDTPIGIDISYVKQIYDNGGKYYNADGEEENIFKIIKEAGYNTVRIKEFVDPYNYNIGDEPVSYGGGTNDLETNLWIAKLANIYDLDIMIDLHYSDFYADPTYQVIPKAWADATSSTQMINYITDYTTETLQAYKDAGIDIAYVQIGNETTNGLFRQMPGTDYSYLTGDHPGYVTNRYDASSSISGYYNSTSTTANWVRYIDAGVEAAKDVFSDIQTIVHVAKGFSGTDWYYEYYNALRNVDYDIIGISGYIYYQGRPNESELGTLLTNLESNFPTKKVMVVETSYGFTTKATTYASNTFSSDLANSSYDVSVQGQASLMRDMLNTLNNHSNGYGFMYWGGDFIPVKGSGWADSTTLSSWANQALFSYDGKALPSLYFLDNL